MRHPMKAKRSTATEALNTHEYSLGELAAAQEVSERV